MAIYFDTKGNEISQEQFIEIYNNIYFYLNRDGQLEKIIDVILKKPVIVKDDLIKILCWKTGYGFDGEKDAIKTRKNIYLSKCNNHKRSLCDIICSGSKKEVLSAQSEEKLLEEISTIEGIGPVYALTLLYFLSNGKRPIYDRFAHLALIAIRQDLQFNDIVKEKDLNNEFSSYRCMGRCLSDYNKYYCTYIKELFDQKEYENSRKTDRALWVYGHLFSENKTNKVKSMYN